MIGESAGPFGLLGGPILAIFGSKGAKWKEDQFKGLKREKIQERETLIFGFEQKFSREQGEAQVKSFFALILSQSVRIE